MNPVTWFELATTDLARAKAFYEGTFGVSLTPMTMGPTTMEMFPADQTQPGSGGALIAGEGYTPSGDGTIVYFSVDDIVATLQRAAAAGGAVLVEKMSIGEFGFIALVQDTEGNRIGLHAME